MSRDSHTRGEVHVGRSGSARIYDDAGLLIAAASGRDDANAQENARRIVACWNAFQAYSTESIEDGGSVIAGVRVMQRAKEMETERQKLLATLRLIVDNAERSEHALRGALEVARLAISEAALFKG